MFRYEPPRSVVAEYMATGKRPQTTSTASHISKHFASATRKERIANAQRPQWRCFTTGSNRDENVIAATSPEREARKRTSCYVLNASKTYHMYERAPDALATLQNAPLDPAELRAVRRREMYARRHEATLQRRRVHDPYVHMTGAQLGAHVVHPSAALAEEMVRRGEGWMIGNNLRQEVDRSGVPIMTHILHGDYFSNDCSRARKTSFVALNKHQIRAASAQVRERRGERAQVGSHKSRQ